MSDRPAATEAALVLDWLVDLNHGDLNHGDLDQSDPDLSALIDEARRQLAAGDEVTAWDCIEAALAAVEAHWLPAIRG